MRFVNFTHEDNLRKKHQYSLLSLTGFQYLNYLNILNIYHKTHESVYWPTGYIFLYNIHKVVIQPTQKVE